MEQFEQHPAHTLAYRESAGVSVPVTQIELADSPNGQPNEPLTVYRTSGPGSEPNAGLKPFGNRGFWRAEMSKIMRGVSAICTMTESLRPAAARRAPSGPADPHLRCVRIPVPGSPKCITHAGA